MRRASRGEVCFHGAMGNTRPSWAVPLALVLSLATHTKAQPLEPSEVPPPLREYVPWVLAAETSYGCTRSGEALVCTWPGLLELTVTGHDVGFALTVVVDRTRAVALPGSVGLWPVDVREANRELVVLAGDAGSPVVTLAAGAHRIEGRIRFGRQPESLTVPADIARIVAVVGAARIPLTRASEGVVPLRTAMTVAATDATSSETDSVSLEIVRRITDGVPLRIDTQITARIGGRARPISLGRALLAGTVPSAVESSLPIQVSAEGDVLLQAQSGTHRIRIASFGANPSMALVSPRLAAPWPTQEIWLFAPSELHRQVEVRGPSSIDPQSPSIPEDWRSSAAYVLEPGQRMTLVERRRAEPELPPNTISVNREMWLDFGGGGFTVRDQLTGEMHRAERIDLVHGELGRVTLGGIDQLITLPPGGARGARGIEVRNERLDMQAEWRFRGSPTDVPAVGWNEDVRSLTVRLNLPPGYTVFAAGGVDRADSAWLEQWDVGPLFLVLLIAVVIARLFDKKSGLLALVTLVLIYFERDAPTFTWLFVLVPFAVLRLFRDGVFARLVFAAFAFFALMLIFEAGYFVTQQVRYAMHPQLLTEDVSYGGSDPSEGVMMEQAPEEPPMATRAASPASSYDSDTREGGRGGAANAPVRLENWIDPNAVVQTGHGLVDWHHTQTTLTWTGPVPKAHRIHLYLIPPWLQRVLAVLRAAGVLFLLALLAKNRPRWPAKSRDEAPATGVVAALIVLVGTLAAGTAQAQVPVPPETPSVGILEELRARLVAPPTCGTECVRFGDAALITAGDELRFEFVVHAGVQAAVPLPGPVASFVPDVVLLDGVATSALRATEDGHLLLRVPVGVHRVALIASLAGRGAMAFSFPSIPGRVEVRAEGWSVSGLDENGLVRGTLELRRDLAPTEAPGTEAQSPGASADVPSWIHVERHLELGVQWLVHTTLRRFSSTTAPAVVRLPALAGESVLGTEATRDGGFIVATLGQGLTELTFTSRIAQEDEVRLSLSDAQVRATDVHTSETWSYTCSPLWHCTHRGIVPIHRAVDAAVRPTFAPYPGESLRIIAERLEAAPGSSFTFDGARLTVSPGSRAQESVLELEVRTSVSNTLRVGLPRGAEVQSVTVDGARRAVQLRDGTLTIGVVPSNHAVSIVFTEPHGLGFETATPRIRLGGETVDVNLVVNIPESRWLLATRGPDWGPIVLFWGQLVLVLVIAGLLGRIPRSPLRTYEWALLALGLTQIPLPATIIVAAWFFAVRVQHERKLTGTLFNVAQLALVLHAFVSACVLIGAVWVGLNDRPDMQIVGNGSSSDTLRWYADRAADTLPSAGFVSVSVWVWKGLMLVWAFWLAYSVVRWAIWAVSPFRDDGFFVRAVPPAPVAPAPIAPAPIAPTAAEPVDPPADVASLEPSPGIDGPAATRDDDDAR